MSYEEQLRFKENKVLNNLMRIGSSNGMRLNASDYGNGDPWRYRNKAQFPFGRIRMGRLLQDFMPEGPMILSGMMTAFWAWKKNQEILGIIKGFMKENGLEPMTRMHIKRLVRHVLIRKV